MTRDRKQIVLGMGMRVDGLDVSDDRMPVGRRFSCSDTQRSRVGPKDLHPPVNRPPRPDAVATRQSGGATSRHHDLAPGQNPLVIDKPSTHGGLSGADRKPLKPSVITEPLTRNVLERRNDDLQAWERMVRHLRDRADRRSPEKPLGAQGDVHRLHARRHAAEAFGSDRAMIARGEDDRNSPRAQGVRDPKGHLPAQVDVRHGAVQPVRGPDRLDLGRKGRMRADHLCPKRGRRPKREVCTIRRMSRMAASASWAQARASGALATGPKTIFPDDRIPSEIACAEEWLSSTTRMCIRCCQLGRVGMLP